MSTFQTSWMQAVVLLFGLGLGSGVYAQSLAGVWRADLATGSLTLRMEQRGATVSGVIESGGRIVANLSGTAQGDSARGAAASPEGEGSFEARATQDTLALILAQEAGPRQQAARLPLEFRRVSLSATPSATGPNGAGGAARPTTRPASAAGGDPRLIGRWSHQDVIVSSGASFASEQFLAFSDDGSVVYARGRAAGGGAGWSFDGGAGGGGERGRWRASEGQLFLERPDGQWARVGRYGMTEDGRTLRIIDEGGARTLWSRR